jgi:putative endonuclease
MPSPRQLAGARLEQLALAHLQAHGLALIQPNFRARFGEVDLVMQEGPDVVFVEVRHRRSADYGGAAASVSRAKQQRVRRAAQLWLMRRYGSKGWPNCRFDVVAFDGVESTAGDPGGLKLNWIRAAF